MNNDSDYHGDEIDLMALIATLWDGKWLISGIVGLSIAIGVIFLLMKPKEIVAEYSILPIPSYELNEYSRFNSFEFSDIDGERLLNLALERLNSREPIITGIRAIGQKNGELSEDDGIREQEILDRAYAIEINSNTVGDNTDWSLRWTSDSRENAREFLSVVLSSVNSSVQDIVTTTFEDEVRSSRLRAEFMIEDLEAEINNAIENYNARTESRLAYLSEQAQIARQLGFAKNALEVQTIASQNAIFTNQTTDSPFYFRGYEAIEKEISLIKSRENVGLFVDDILDLRQQKKSIIEDRTIGRAISAFEKTSVANRDEFRAINTDVLSIEFKNSTNNILIILVLSILGGMAGTVIVLVRSGMKNYRKRKASESVLD